MASQHLASFDESFSGVTIKRTNNNNNTNTNNILGSNFLKDVSLLADGAELKHPWKNLVTRQQALRRGRATGDCNPHTHTHTKYTADAHRHTHCDLLSCAAVTSTGAIVKDGGRLRS